MALPLAPLAGTVLKYGAVALAGYIVARGMLQPGRTDQRAEDALDDLHEGVAAHRPRDRGPQLNAAARLRRVVRLGRAGPGIEIDAAALGRLRFRRV